MVELSSCPFCGGPARFAQVAGEMPHMWPIVRCDDCDARSCACATQDLALAAWNTRPHPAPLDPDARAREAVKIAQAVHAWIMPHLKYIISFNTLTEVVEAALAERPVVEQALMLDISTLSVEQVGQINALYLDLLQIASTEGRVDG